MFVTEATTQEAIEATYTIAYQLYEMPIERYTGYIYEMMGQGYRLIALEDDGKLIGISGFRVGRRLYCGKYLHIDNLVVDKACRKQGAALEMLEWMKAEAERIGCDCLLADTYIENAPAQALFKREGFTTRGYHLKQDI